MGMLVEKMKEVKRRDGKWEINSTVVLSASELFCRKYRRYL